MGRAHQRNFPDGGGYMRILLLLWVGVSNALSSGLGECPNAQW